MTLCVSGVVRAVHQSSSKLGDTPLVRLDLSLSHCLPGGLAVEPLTTNSTAKSRYLHRSTGDSHRHAPDVELYSSTALQSALHLYISTALYTLHPLHPPSVYNVKSLQQENTTPSPFSPRTDYGGPVARRRRAERTVRRSRRAGRDEGGSCGDQQEDVRRD